MSNRWINHGTTRFPSVDTKKMEALKNCKFVAELAVRGKYGWTESPAQIYYQETPPQPEFSNYFGLIYQGSSLYIIDGSSVVGMPIEGIQTPDGEIIYSRFRHDFRKANTAEVFVDGGFDYLKLSGDFASCQRVTLTIKGAELVVVDDLDEQTALYDAKQAMIDAEIAKSRAGRA